MSILDPVDVEVRTFSELFACSSLPLKLDTYQRDFVWTGERMRQLVIDLDGYQANAHPKPPYYMGTVLLHFHPEKGFRFIIDGQQRLTALCVLHRHLTGALPVPCKLAYSPKSARQIRAVSQGLQDPDLESRDPDLHEAVSRLGPEIFAEIVFTVVTVGRADMAFTFFDTQNNRGVPLHATDLLKAYHLREVDAEAADHREGLQDRCAQRWERIQQGTPVLSSVPEFTSSLFTRFLWRARAWTGKQVGPGGHDELLDRFQKRTLPATGGDGTVPLYQARYNQLGSALTLGREGEQEIHPRRISFSPHAVNLPFAIRQPIHKGIGFFLYADKYASLLRWLVVDATGSGEVARFRKVYTQLTAANSNFLREVFLLAALMFADQFGDEKLWEFALWLDHALGAVRLEKYSVRMAAAQNFFGKDESGNLLDVIAHGYRPEEAIGHLQNREQWRKIYAGSDDIVPGSGVRGIYKQAVLAYYERSSTDSLRTKESWLRKKLGEEEKISREN